MSNINSDMQSSDFMQDASFFTCCRHNRVRKLYVKNSNLFTFVSEQSKKSSGGHDLDLFHVDDATLFLCNGDVRLVFMAAESCINSSTFPTALNAHFLYPLGERVLSAHRNLHDRVNRRNAMEGTEPVSFVEFLNTPSQSTATRMSHGSKVLWQ